MATTAQADKILSATTEQNSTETIVNELVTVVEQQQEQIDQLQQTVKELRDDVEQDDHVGHEDTDAEHEGNDADRADDQDGSDDHDDDLRDDLRDERVTRAKADAEIRQRVTDVEERVDDLEDRSVDANPTPDGKETTIQEPVTPLEDLVTLPNTVIDQESANTRRAVFVAKDVAEYTTSVPAGRMITSSELRRVLKAGTDASGHTQTVSRVMDLLNDLGGDDVEVVDRRGTRKLVFTDELVDRLTELTSRGQPHSCDQARA